MKRGLLQIDYGGHEKPPASRANPAPRDLQTEHTVNGRVDQSGWSIGEMLSDCGKWLASP